MVTFPTYQFINILSQKTERNVGGIPLSTPWKWKPTKNDPRMNAYNPYFSINKAIKVTVSFKAIESI